MNQRLLKILQKKTKDETKTSDEKETTVTDNKDTISTYTNKIMWDAVDANSISINRITGEFTALKAGKYQVMSTTDSGLICYSTIDVKQPSTAFNINESKIFKSCKGICRKIYYYDST